MCAALLLVFSLKLILFVELQDWKFEWGLAFWFCYHLEKQVFSLKWIFSMFLNVFKLLLVKCLRYIWYYGTMKLWMGPRLLNLLPPWETSFFSKVSIFHAFECFLTFSSKMPVVSLFVELRYWNFEWSLVFWICYHLEKQVFSLKSIFVMFLNVFKLLVVKCLQYLCLQSFDIEILHGPSSFEFVTTLRNKFFL